MGASTVSFATSRSRTSDADFMRAASSAFLTMLDCDVAAYSVFPIKRPIVSSKSNSQ